MDVHDRHQHRKPLQIRLRRHIRHPIHHQAHVKTRPSHVDADQMVLVQHLAQRRRADRPSNRPGEDRLNGVAFGRCRRHHPSVRLHHVQPLSESARPHLVLQPRQIAFDDRRDVGIDDRRARALILPPLPRHLMRQRHRYPRQPLPQHLPDAQLMRRVGVRVQQAHRHRFESVGLDLLQDRPQLFLPQRSLYRAIVQHPLRHLIDVPPSHQRLGLLIEQIVHVRPVGPPDLVHVAKPFRRQQRHVGPLALQKGVDARRRAVDEKVQVGQV